MMNYVLFYNKESGYGEIGHFTSAGIYESLSSGQFLGGQDGWDIIQGGYDVLHSDGGRSRSLAYYKRSNGRLDFGGLDFAHNPPIHVTTSNHAIEPGWDFLFPFEWPGPISCALYIDKNGKSKLVAGGVEVARPAFSPWSHIVEVGPRFFFYNQQNGRTALGNITGVANHTPIEGGFGHTTFAVTGFGSHALSDLPVGYQHVVATKQYVLLYHSQTGKYLVGTVESDQWQPVKSGLEILTKLPAQEKQTEAGYSHVTFLGNDDLLFYDAGSGKAFVATVSQKISVLGSDLKTFQISDLLHVKHRYEANAFAKNWTHIVAFQVDWNIVH